MQTIQGRECILVHDQFLLNCDWLPQFSKTRNPLGSPRNMCALANTWLSSRFHFNCWSLLLGVFIPGFIHGVLYAPHSAGYERARRLRQRFLWSCRRQTRSPFPRVALRVEEVGMLAYLLVGQIYVHGNYNSLRYERVLGDKSCENRYCCCLRLFLEEKLWLWT